MAPQVCGMAALLPILVLQGLGGAGAASTCSADEPECAEAKMEESSLLSIAKRAARKPADGSEELCGSDGGTFLYNGDYNEWKSCKQVLIGEKSWWTSLGPEDPDRKVFKSRCCGTSLANELCGSDGGKFLFNGAYNKWKSCEQVLIGEKSWWTSLGPEDPARKDFKSNCCGTALAGKLCGTGEKFRLKGDYNEWKSCEHVLIDDKNWWTSLGLEDPDRKDFVSKCCDIDSTGGADLGEKLCGDGYGGKFRYKRQYNKWKSCKHVLINEASWWTNLMRDDPALKDFQSKCCKQLT